MNLSSRGWITIFSDRGLLQYYGEEFDRKYNLYKDANILHPLTTSSHDNESILCMQITLGYVITDFFAFERTVSLFEKAYCNTHSRFVC